MPCLARFNRALLASHSKVSTPEIQTTFAPIVHPKMKSGKEPFKCGMESAECGVRDKSDFRHRQASCAEPARPVRFHVISARQVAPAAFGMRIQRSGFRQKAATLNSRHGLRRSAETPLRPPGFGLRWQAAVAREISPKKFAH